MGAQGEIKWSPSWTQNAPKSKTKKKMPKEVFQARIREVLKPSWSDLWAILAELAAILAELAAILGRFGGGWGRAKSLLFLTIVNAF